MLRYVFSQSFEQIRKSEPQNRRILNVEVDSCPVASAVQKALKVWIVPIAIWPL